MGAAPLPATPEVPVQRGIVIGENFNNEELGIMLKDYKKDIATYPLRVPRSSITGSPEFVQLEAKKKIVTALEKEIKRRQVLNFNDPSF